jgi:hypothetical protein
MPDRGIKKAIIQSTNLPEPLISQGQYLVRYRIVSEDRNRRSHWSPIYYIDPISSGDEES